MSDERLEQIKANLAGGYKTGNGDTLYLIERVERLEAALREPTEDMIDAAAAEGLKWMALTDRQMADKAEKMLRAAGRAALGSDKPLPAP